MGSKVSHPLDSNGNTQQIDHLITLFLTNPENAIIECQKLICRSSSFDSYDQFYLYHLNHSHISTCQKEWQVNRMSVHCFDCSLNNSSCICLQCFLNGDHKGHNYVIQPETIGNCDCGDSSLWKKEGFCKNHQGNNETDNRPENYLSEELRSTLTDCVFKSAFEALTKVKKEQDQIASQIFQFIFSFLKFGDGFRRLIAISLTEKINFSEFFSNITNYSLQFNQLFQKLCGKLINDQVFKQNFSKATYSVILDYMKDSNDDLIHKFWSEFFYHSFSPQPIYYNISHNEWDWVDFVIKFFIETKEFFKYVGDEDFSKSYPDFTYSLIAGVAYATAFQPNEETQTLFNRLFSEVFNCGSKESSINDSIIPVSFRGKSENYYYLSAKMFMLILYPLFNSFKFKKTLEYDVLIDQLEKNSDISPIYNQNSNENDKLISKFMKRDDKYDKDEVTIFPFFYYGSFHNGASFFLSMPLYDCFVNILGLENICKIKISRFLMQEKYQKLRIKLGIITLKKILSYVCYNQSLTPKNFGLIKLIDFDSSSPKLATFSISRYLPVLQLLVGLQCNNEKDEFNLKEFFAYEMAKEIGLFDDFTSEDYDSEDINETRSKMNFSFLYLSLLLVVERILFNFNSNDFIREQLVFALKSGQSDINDLNQSYDKRVLDDYENPINFNTVLFNIATIVTRKRSSSEFNTDSTKEDISFVLKDNIKWNTITAIIPVVKQKSMLNNEISKNPNTLINIQEFEPEETYFFNTSLFSLSSLTTCTYNSKNNMIEDEKPDLNGLNIRLMGFLVTPTVLAVVYHSLRSNLEDSGSPRVDLNDHLSLNILILISKFIKEGENNQDLFNETINYDSIEELIMKFKTSIFKYKVEKDENATIENTINKNNFNSLLNLKISYQGKSPKSFIEIILSKGEIGKSALNKMSLNHVLNNDENENNKDNEEAMKKQRAKRFKEEIMNKYKNMISNYSLNENENELERSSSLEHIESSDCLLSPTCSGVINGTTDVCSICSSIKKDEHLCYPLFIYQTKFPFIVDKPPLNEGEDDEISVSCDDDVFLDDEEEEEEEGNEEERTANDQRNREEDALALRQVDMQIQSVTELAREYIAHRANGTVSNEEEATFTALPQIRERLLIQKEIILNKIFIRNLKALKKEIKKENKKKRIEEKEKNVKQTKRYTAGANFVIQFSICQHLVHSSCVDSEIYHCPIDRTIKNGFLPSLESSENLTENEKKSIDVFLSCYRKMIVPVQSRKVDIFTELIKSLSGLIVTNEIRLRNLPNCLDSNNTKLLARNLFLTTYHAYRIKEKPSITDTKPYNNMVQNDVESRLTTFQIFIKKLIETDDIENIPLKSIVSSFISKMKNEETEKSEKEIVLFLRRVCLAEYFLLGKSDINVDDDGYINKFIEWDEVLSIENLSKRFDFEFHFLKEDFEFKPFVCSNLPKEFLHFALQPFNFPVDLTQELTIYNLIDYNYLIDNYNDDDETIINKKEEKSMTLEESKFKLYLSLNYNQKHYPSALLLIGKFASRILLINDDYTTSMKPFYLDKYGSPDFGFSRGEPLFLNEERYEKFLDEILSGNFANNI